MCNHKQKSTKNWSENTDIPVPVEEVQMDITILTPDNEKKYVGK